MQTTTDLTNAAASGGLMAAFGAYMFVYWVLLIIMIVAYWRIFTKAGKPGWASIIPIYNVIVLLEIIGRPIWWIILFFIPVVNLVIYAITILDLSNSFGKGLGFAIGLIFLPFIFMLILGFGSAQYQGPLKNAEEAPAPVA